MRRAARAAAILVLGVGALLEAGCGTCRGGSPVVMRRPGIGGTIGSSGQGSIYPTGGVGLDLSNVLCRNPDPSTLPQPGPGSPPIQDPPEASGPSSAAPPASSQNAPNIPKSKELPAGAEPI